MCENTMTTSRARNYTNKLQINIVASLEAASHSAGQKITFFRNLKFDNRLYNTA
jgi:hypothetical protein